MRSNATAPKISLQQNTFNPHIQRRFIWETTECFTNILCVQYAGHTFDFDHDQILYFCDNTCGFIMDQE